MAPTSTAAREDEQLQLPKTKKRKRRDGDQNFTPSVFDSLRPRVTANLRRHGITSPLPSQSAILPLLLPQHPQHHNGDLCFQAPTGSGKTLAYLLPLIEGLKDHIVTKLRAVIVLPTRDLVKQVQGVLERCSSGTGIKVGTAVGNQTLQAERGILVHSGQQYDPKGYATMLERAKRRSIYFGLVPEAEFEPLPENILDYLPNHVPEYSSKVDVLICTPGRLVQHLRTTTGFTLDDVEWLIVDEVDSLLDQSFQEWVGHVVEALEREREPKTSRERVLSALRRTRRARRRYVRKVVLSATINKDVGVLRPLKLRRLRVEIIEGQKDGVTHETVHVKHSTATPEDGKELETKPDLEEFAIAAGDGSRKPLFLLKLLHLLLPAKSLVFCNSTEGAARLHRLLSLLDPALSPLLALATSNTASGLKAVAAFRTGRKTVLIATDRASRGLDIADLAHVVNYDLPNKKVGNYTHRVGRTARAGKTGKAWSLVTKDEERRFWRGIAVERRDQIGREVEKYALDITDVAEEKMEEYEKALMQLKEETEKPGMPSLPLH